MEISSEEYKKYKLLLLKEEIEEYAHEFWSVLNREVFYMSAPENILPIHVKKVEFKEYVKNGNSAAVMSSRPLPSGAELICVTIYFTGYGDINYIKQNVRHELLHLALHINNLKDSDYDAIFKLLCDRYDAHFYKKITGIDEKIYLGAKEYIESAFSVMDKYQDKVLNCAISEMIFEVGKKCIGEESDVIEMRNSLKKKLEDITIYIEDVINKNK